MLAVIVSPNDRTTRAALLLLGVAVVASSCASEPRGASTAARQSQSRSTEWGSYLVSWRSNEGPLRVGELHALEVHVARVDEAPIPAEVSIRVSAWMPDHRHGANLAPVARALAPGVFAVDGLLLHMPGHWQLFIDVLEPGDAERSVFDVELE